MSALWVGEEKEERLKNPEKALESVQRSNSREGYTKGY